MGIETAYTIFGDVFNNLIIFNVEWIISLVVSFLTMLIITRDFSKWKVIAFPVMLGWHIAGLTPNFLIYLMAGIIFAVEALSLQTISDILSVANKQAKKTISSIYDRTDYGTRRKLVKELSKTKEKEMLRRVKKGIRSDSKDKSRGEIEADFIKTRMTKPQSEKQAIYYDIQRAVGDRRRKKSAVIPKERRLTFETYEEYLKKQGIDKI